MCQTISRVSRPCSNLLGEDEDQQLMNTNSLLCIVFSHTCSCDYESSDCVIRESVDSLCRDGATRNI